MKSLMVGKSHIWENSYSRDLCAKALDQSDCWIFQITIFWTVQPFLIFFCIKIEYHKTFKMMLLLFRKNAHFPKNRAKWSKSGQGSWKKSTFLYIAQNWLIIYFLIFCIKVEGIKGYKLAQTPFLGKFSFCRFWSFLLIFGPKIKFFVYCSKLAHYRFLQKQSDLSVSYRI